MDGTFTRSFTTGGAQTDYLVAGNYADLASTYPPALYDGYLAYVSNSSGIWYVNRKKAGWYQSNGTSWVVSSSALTMRFYDGAYTYADKQLAIGSDGHIYRSLQAGNLGNDPTTYPSVFWEQVVNGAPYIDLEKNLASNPAYKEARLFYDQSKGAVSYYNSVNGITVNLGQETFILFFNNTGVEIANGSPINAFGVNAANEILNGIVADAASPVTSSAVIGAATHDVPHNSIGFSTILGSISDVKTDTFNTSGPLYLGVSPDLYTQTRPRFPNSIVVMGSVLVSDATVGKIFIKPSSFTRQAGNKSYSFTSQGVLAGSYFVGGFYKFEPTNTTLTQASLTQTYGSALTAYCAHASAIFGGAGTVDAGVVGLRVNGTSITDLGVLTIGDSEIITSDITSVVLNQYIETPKKWVGTITYELFVVSGTPTAFSLDFNYGLAKYEDVGNIDFTIRDFEVVGTAGAPDTNFNVELLHHKFTGWTYAATGFIAGNGNIVSMSELLAPYDNLTNGDPFSIKQIGINQFIDGNGSEGVLVRITCGSNNSVQSMNVHIAASSEELV